MRQLVIEMLVVWNVVTFTFHLAPVVDVDRSDRIGHDDSFTVHMIRPPGQGEVRGNCGAKRVLALVRIEQTIQQQVSSK
jgi:hypothetical protein